MAVSARKQVMFWGIGFLLLALTLWALGSTLAPFMLGAAIAYLLDPLADRLERLGLGRVAATAIIALLVVLGFVLTMGLVVPALIDQGQQLAAAVPEWIAWMQEMLARRFPSSDDQEALLRRGLTTLQEHFKEIGPGVINSVLASSMAVVDFVLIMVVAPVVAFYLLLDWDRMLATLDGWLPREHAPTIRAIMRDIDRTLAGFVRGQLSVCLIQGTFYAVALTLIGLPFGFLVGMLAGLLAFIPYVGALVGGVLSMAIAIFSFWEQPLWIFVTAGIFAFGQFVEGNVLTPKLVGKSVGLHPVLLILALAVFGRLFGFAGMLVAVPVAASLGVLGRFAVGRYLESPLYTGRRPPGVG
ncbi:MAG TPA: AI-2E family transporter [Amaricoccus sp.]|uniref:AI-2E family transporter n=1 Tax=Amaricoccus sp. TaxID=1872485 RepID=UPI002C5A59B6|nr:AI-2E family transporter [Amaricoccus sp.]HMQ92715.1 AI-2E family transporter [Amaricoccus sp.]HMR52542.1 AI-2E family transporter [Amaricoccus sp.]HMR61536.1 AI-2E family transporter [Amaricoccus sp.]HMT99463.1 AI-2E family transporter [Amaricoccus sp.]